MNFFFSRVVHGYGADSLPFFFYSTLSTVIVLDEATSSMDAVSANEMFRQCHLLKITCISVCHNSSLEQYHAQRISLDGQGGWAFSPILHNSPSVDTEMDTLAGPSDDSSRSN